MSDWTDAGEPFPCGSDVRALMNRSGVTVVRFGTDGAVTDVVADALQRTADGSVADALQARWFRFGPQAMEGEEAHSFGWNFNEAELATVTSPLRTDEGEPEGVLTVTVDLTDCREAERRMTSIGRLDPLTGLANRAQFLEVLDRTLRTELSSSAAVGVAVIDVDGFGDINKSVGFKAGDRLLIDVARAITGCLRHRDIAARLVSDRFAVVFSPSISHAHARTVVERIVSAVAMITNPATEQPLTVSIGLAFRTMRSRGPQLLDEASAAMEECRQLGGDRWAAFSVQTATLHEVERRRVAELTRGIENNELGLYFQPIVNLETGEVRGAEALVRWIHPVDGVLYPAEFVAIAEGGGLIGALTEKVLREATAHLKEWAPLLSDKEFFLGVNVSAADIADDEFVARVDASLREAAVPPSLLTIELTETAVLADVERAAASLEQLRNLGLSVALDDFGTGYASLAVLRELPVDVMKIDQSFVSGLPDNHDAAVVRLILGLAEELGLRVTAEGVETEEQRKVLFDLGCRTGQGYLFGAPLTAEDFEDRYLR